jgi:hypothetical protein
MKEEILKKIKLLLGKYGIKSEQITLESTMQSFKMVSEEVFDFLKDYGNHFNVDFTGFRYYDYFFEEMHPIYVIRDLFYRIFVPSKIRKTPLTIEHLVRVAERGKWFNPE